MIYNVAVKDAKGEVRSAFSRSDFKLAVRDAGAEAAKLPHTKVSYIQPSITIYEVDDKDRVTLVYYELCVCE